MPNFHGSVTAISARIFMKFPPKCKTKKLGMIYTILGSFCSLLNWKGADIWSQIRPRKIPEWIHAKLALFCQEIFLEGTNVPRTSAAIKVRDKW